MHMLYLQKIKNIVFVSYCILVMCISIILLGLKIIYYTVLTVRFWLDIKVVNPEKVILH